MAKSNAPGKKLEWWRNPVAILAHAYEGVTYARTEKEMEAVVRWKRSMRFDAEHLLGNESMLQGGEGGDDARAYIFKNRSGYKEDWLGRYLPIAHKHGLKVILYFNVHWFKSASFPPEYFMLNAPGRPRSAYGSGLIVCPRGPFLAWACTMAEDIGAYPLDGVFLDGPMADYCACPACSNAFLGQYKIPLPETVGKAPLEARLALRDFMQESAAAFINRFAQTLHGKNPSAVVYNNNMAMGTEGLIMRNTLASTRLIGSEGGFEGYAPLDNTFPFKPGISAKILESRARGRGRVIFSDSGFKVYDYYAHPEGEITRMYANTIAGGASPWFLILPKGGEKRGGTPEGIRFNRFIGKNRESLADAASMAGTAILHSTVNFRYVNAIHYKGPVEDVGHSQESAGAAGASFRHFAEFQGAYAALARSGHPFDVIEEDGILEGAMPERIRLVILPGVSLMSEALGHALRKFVENGGNLLASYDTGLYDENGKRRPDYLLADLFGADLDGELQGPSKLDYLSVPANGIARGLSQSLLPCPESWYHVKAREGAEPLLYYHEKMPRRYARLTPASRRPAALLNRFGKGSVIFIPSAIFDHYRTWHFGEQRVLLANAAAFLAPPPVRVRGGGEFVEAVLRQTPPGGIVLHLINWAAGERPSRTAIPLGPLSVYVRVPKGIKVRRAEARYRAGALKFSRKPGGVEIRLPCLKGYEMICLG